MSDTKQKLLTHTEPLSTEQAQNLFKQSTNELRQEVIELAQNSEFVEQWFLDEHLREVERWAVNLCQAYPEADLNLVVLAVWFHDIGRLFGHDQGHAEWGAKSAENLLKNKNYPAKDISVVVEACRSHGCKQIMPQTLEGKILATADAVSHFFHDFYQNASKYYQSKGMTPDEVKQTIRAKLERDYHVKIQFEEAREFVEEIYQQLSAEFN